MRTLFITIVAFNVTFGAAWSVLVLYASERLGMDEVGFGLITTAMAIGGIVGTFSYGALERRFSLGDIMRVGLLIETGTHLVLALTTLPVVALATFTVFGAHAFVWHTTSTTVRQRAVPDELMGRVTGVYTVGVFAGIVVGTPLGGLLAREFGITAPFWFGFIGSALLVAVLWRQFDKIAHAGDAAPDTGTAGADGVARRRGSARSDRGFDRGLRRATVFRRLRLEAARQPREDGEHDGGHAEERAPWRGEVARRVRQLPRDHRGERDDGGQDPCVRDAAGDVFDADEHQQQAGQDEEPADQEIDGPEQHELDWRRARGRPRDDHLCHDEHLGHDLERQQHQQGIGEHSDGAGAPAVGIGIRSGAERIIGHRHLPVSRGVVPDGSCPDDASSAPASVVCACC